MSETIQHTPEPWEWKAQGCANEYVLLTNDMQWLMAIRQNGELSTLQHEANMRLLSKAPELLDALESVINATLPIATKNEKPIYHPSVALAKELISQVRGSI